MFDQIDHRTAVDAPISLSALFYEMRRRAADDAVAMMFYAEVPRIFL